MLSGKGTELAKIHPNNLRYQGGFLQPIRDHAFGRNEITVCSRAIMLFDTDNDVHKRVHRVCSKIA